MKTVVITGTHATGVVFTHVVKNTSLLGVIASLYTILSKETKWFTNGIVSVKITTYPSDPTE